MKTIGTLIFVLLSGAAQAAPQDINSSDFYTRLGLEAGATPEQIKQAHRQLSKMYHPDIAGGGSLQNMQRLNEAKDGLLNPKKRTSSASSQSGQQQQGNPFREPPRQDQSAGLSAEEKVSFVQMSLWFDFRVADITRKMGDKADDQPITILYMVMAEYSRKQQLEGRTGGWSMDGSALTDALLSLVQGGPGERLAFEKFVRDYITLRLGYAAAQIALELLNKSRVEVMGIMMASHYRDGMEYILLEDIIRSMYRVPSGNTGNLVAFVNSLARGKYDPVGLKLYGAKIQDLALAYMNLREVSKTSAPKSKKGSFKDWCESILRSARGR